MLSNLKFLAKIYSLFDALNACHFENHKRVNMQSKSLCVWYGMVTLCNFVSKCCSAFIVRIVSLCITIMTNLSMSLWVVMTDYVVTLSPIALRSHMQTLHYFSKQQFPNLVV